MGKLFNNNNCKISYSTMPNLKQFISGHNKKILKKNEPKKAEKVCNCRGGVKNCPVEGNCRKQEVIYEVEVSADLKDMNIKPVLKYRIKETAQAYRPVTDKCRLCLTEKLEILLADEKKYLNERSELLAKCRHANSYMLSGVT